MIRTVARLGDHSGVLRTYAAIRRTIIGSQVAIVMYHRVCPHTDHWSLESLDPLDFQAQMEYIGREYEIFSLGKLFGYLQSKSNLPKKAVVITFDDGYKDNYTCAYPILRQLRIPATFFLTTGHIGTDRLFWWDEVAYALWNTQAQDVRVNHLMRYELKSNRDRLRAISHIQSMLKSVPEENKLSLISEVTESLGVKAPSELGRNMILTWDEIREMSDHDMEFGAHTVTHPILHNVPLQQAAWEVVESKKVIETAIGRRAGSFAYPGGVFNADIIDLVRRAGFDCAVTTAHGWVGRRPNQYALARVPASDDLSKFKGSLSGLWADWKRISTRKKWLH